jgi:polar amino acid transport system substrate-binding protein
MFGSLAQMRLGGARAQGHPVRLEDELVAAVASGEVDAAAATPTSIGWFNKGRPDRALAVAHAYDHEPELAWELAVGLRRSDPPMRREVDRIVAAMLADGAFARIYAAYGIEHAPAGRRSGRAPP